MSVEYVHTLTKLWKLSIILQVCLEGTKWLMVVEINEWSFAEKKLFNFGTIDFNQKLLSSGY